MGQQTESQGAAPKGVEIPPESEWVTPHAHNRLRRAIRAEYADLRAKLAEIRRLRSTGRYLDAQDAAAGLDALLGYHWPRVRALRRRWLSEHVVKYANVSPAAAARLSQRAALSEQQS